MNRLCLLLLIVCPYFVQAQWLTGIGSKWNDSFIEWALFTEDEEVEGSLEIRWKRQLDFSIWEYRKKGLFWKGKEERLRIK